MKEVQKLKVEMKMKKNTRKAAAVLSAIVLTMGLVACGNGNTTTTSAGTSAGTTPTTTTAGTTAGTTTP